MKNRKLRKRVKQLELEVHVLQGQVDELKSRLAPRYVGPPIKWDTPRITSAIGKALTRERRMNGINIESRR
jgi:hypothetical protein